MPGWLTNSHAARSVMRLGPERSVARTDRAVRLTCRPSRMRSLATFVTAAARSALSFSVVTT
jgi:hypothetical protein